MIKPKPLKKGDTVAIVSLSSGMGGEPMYRYRYEIAKKRLKELFGLHVIEMPHTLSGIAYLNAHPDQRAQDLMDAFEDPSVSAIFCMIGGDDTIRLLPYIDFDVIRKNPKIFMGYSDTTINHFMMFHAGLVSYHGPCMLVEFAENVKMHDYTVRSIRRTLFEPEDTLKITSSPEWTSEFLDWGNPKYQAIPRKMHKEIHSYELLQGKGVVSGPLIGGCLGVFRMMIGTKIWPTLNEWDGKILFLETAEDYPTPEDVCYFLRNLSAQGILERLHGIVVGKPLGERYYNEYKAIYQQVVGVEAGLSDLPILYNVNCSHNAPCTILPYGINAQIDCNRPSLTLLEPAVAY